MRLLLFDSQAPDTIYVAKNKSPLLIGVGEGYNMVCSDAMAMIRETSQFMEIHDKELGCSDQRLLSQLPIMKEMLLNAVLIQLNLIFLIFGKGTYPYYMLKEIDEQPTVMRKLISTYADDEGNITVDPAIVKSVQEADRIYILAAGTSYNAGFASKAMFEKLTDTPVEIGVASEWGYNIPLLSKNQCLFCLVNQVKQQIAVKFW